jgi:hypothetical protein
VQAVQAHLTTTAVRLVAAAPTVRPAARLVAIEGRAADTVAFCVDRTDRRAATTGTAAADIAWAAIVWWVRREIK